MAILQSDYSSIEQSDSTSWIDWTTIDNAVDSTSNTFAEVDLTGISPGITDPAFAEYLWVWNHGIDTTSNDYIHKVEVGLKYYVDGILNFGDYGPDKYLYLIGYNNTTGEDSNWFELPFQSSNEIYWKDVTNMGDFPGFGNWEWSDIEDLQMKLDAGTIDTTGTFIIYVDQFIIRITTTSSETGKFGFQCWDSTGNITLDTTDRISRLLYSKEVAAYADGDDQFPSPPGGKDRTFGFALALDPVEGAIPHSVEITGSGANLTVTWTEASKTVNIAGTNYYAFKSSASLITVFGW